MPTEAQALWAFLPLGYLLTVLIETPVLLAGLSARHPFRHRLFAGLWLTACTYPVVILVFPLVIDRAEHPALYYWVAESFAPLAECALFWAAFGKRELVGTRSMWRDLAAVTAANLASFGLGELGFELGVLDWMSPRFYQ